MAGFEVVVVACDERGNVDLDDLRAKIDTNRARLGALMVTYPSTHGVFEDEITEVCALVHDGRWAGVPRWRQPQRDGRARSPGQVRCRRLAPELAQDVLHPARRRRSGRRADRRARASRSVLAEPSARRRGGACDRRRPDRRCAVGLGAHPHDPLGLRARHGTRWPAHRDAGRDPERELHRPAPRAALPHPLHGRTRGSSPTSASSICGRSPSRPGSRSTTSRSGSSTTASTRRRCRSPWPAR